MKLVAKFFYATDYTDLHRLVAQIFIRVFVALSKLQRSVIYAMLSSMQVNLFLKLQAWTLEVAGEISGKVFLCHRLH